MSLLNKIDIVDFGWSADGDFLLENGDIKDTFNKTGEGFIQEVEDRVKSSIDDWKLTPSRGTGLEEFEGELNNEDTWERIRNRINFSLTSDYFLGEQDLNIIIAPISDMEIAIRIDFKMDLIQEEIDSDITLKVLFSLDGKGPYIVR